MISEVLRSQTHLPPEAPGDIFYAETASCIAADDHPAFQSMVAVMEGYAQQVHDGWLELTDDIHSEDDLMTALAATEHQRRHAFWLRQGAIPDYDDDALYAMSQGGTFERLVAPEVIFQPWAEIPPPSISELQLAVLQQAIAHRAPHTTNEAEIVALQYICEKLGIKQDFREPVTLPIVTETSAAALGSTATRCDLPPVRIPQQPAPERSVWRMPVRLALATLAVGIGGPFNGQPVK